MQYAAVCRLVLVGNITLVHLVVGVLCVGCWGYLFSVSFLHNTTRQREAISWRKLLSSVLPMFKHLLLPLTVHIGELWFWFVIFVHSGIENGMCSIVQCTIRPPKRSFRFSTSARKGSYLSLSKQWIPLGAI